MDADSKGNGYGLEISNQNIVKVDAVTGEITRYSTPTKNSGPRRGRFDAQDRLWFGEFRGNKIGMLDTRTGTFKEWPVPTPWTGPYDATLDKNGDAWTDGMFSDRVVRVNTDHGRGCRIFAAARDQHAPRVRRQLDDAGDVLGGQ